MTVVGFECPWCGKQNVRGLQPDLFDFDFACNVCHQPIEIRVNDSGSITRLKRVELRDSNKSAASQPVIQIGHNFGSVAVGGNATVTHIYEQTIKEIEQAETIAPEQKKQAKGILEHVNTYAKPFLPVIAGAIKVGLGLP